MQSYALLGEGLPPQPTLLSSFKTTLLYSPLNILLIFFIPGILSHLFNLGDTWVFALNFLAIIPLSKLLSVATDEISLRTSQTLGGLINATFGNLVELIMSFLALNKGLIRVIQASLLGSILSNLMLVLGFCFLLGGMKYEIQKFNETAAQTSASLLAIAVGAFMLPAAFANQVSNQFESNGLILDLSRGCSIVLLILYFLYLIFQLKTHHKFYQDNSEGEEQLPSLDFKFSIGLLVSVTLLIALSAELLVGSIEGLSTTWNLSETFVGLILLPIVGNAAEHVTAVTSAMSNKMDLSLGVAVGSSMQIALLVCPITVLAGWLINQPMSLHFSMFETVIMFISIFTVNSIIADGKSHWLEGAMLLGIASGAAKWGDTPTFIINFLAIIPLAKLLGLATEEIALRTNHTIGGLVNASFGNLVELIVSIIALKNGLINVVQASLLGSILSNLLLVLGFCFVCGGWTRKEQYFNETAAQTSASLLGIAVAVYVLPTAFANNSIQALDPTRQTTLILQLSRGCAVILLVLYILYLFFQLKTHLYLYADNNDAEEETKTLDIKFAVFLLFISTAFIGICAEYLVDSITGVSTKWGISQTFVGLILLPIVGNAAEHISAVTVSIKDKMNLALGIAIGSSMQIALFVTPVIVLLGWIINQPMTLEFSVFETIILFFAIFIVNSIISDGKSHWMEGIFGVVLVILGAMLIGMYTLIGLSFFLLPV